MVRFLLLASVVSCAVLPVTNAPVHLCIHARACILLCICIYTCARLIDASCQLNLFAAVSADRFGK
jgi:hypothetical protein